MAPIFTSHSFRMALFYAASFLFIGVFMPYFPSWLEARGFSVVEIGLITGLPFFLRMPIIFALGVSADAIGDRRLLVIGLMALSLGAVLTLPFVEQFWPVFATVALMSTAFGAIVPLSDAIALSGPKNSQDNYGRVRLWGSVTFIVGNIACGATITTYGPSIILVWAIGALALSLVLAFFLTCFLAMVGWVAALPFKRSRVLPLGPWLSLSFLVVVIFYKPIVASPVVERFVTLSAVLWGDPVPPGTFDAGR